MIERFNKRRLVIGLVAMAICFAVCYYVSDSIFKSLILSAAFLLISLVKIKIPELMQPIATVGSLIISSIAALLLSQFVQGEGVSSVGIKNMCLGLCCCLVLAGLLYLIIPNVRINVIVTVGLTLLLATANSFVCKFRGSELFPIDFLSAGTAMNVANQYKFEITPNMTYAWVLFFLLIWCFCAVQLRKRERKSKEYLGVFVGVMIFCGGFLWGTQDINAIHFGNGGTYYNGYILNFTLSIKELFVEKPEGYSVEKVEQIAEEYIEKSHKGVSGKTPNIIVIMDEAYSDLGVLGENFNTSEEVSPFIQSLEENTVKGYALSSAYGGRTANSEFEFLTGATLGFVPKGTVAYQQYVSEKTYSMPAVLKKLGYNTVAMHPFHKDGWRRNVVWPELGFEECYFLEDFPQKDLMRGFVSDKEMIEQVISCYEKQEASVPLFLFGVTMQNHSSYDYGGKDFNENIRLEGYVSEHSAANQYLSLINETDRAVEYLIEYLLEQERETVVVFFGDHLPALGTELYEEIHGGAFEGLNEEMLHYKVPFFIWSNYDIEEKEVECTSLSFLSTLVYEAAGIDFPPYNMFIKELQDVIPSINMEGYYSKKKGAFIPISEAEGEEKEWLNYYQQIQYRYLFDVPNSKFYGMK